MCRGLRDRSDRGRDGRRERAALQAIKDETDARFRVALRALLHFGYVSDEPRALVDHRMPVLLDGLGGLEHDLIADVCAAHVERVLQLRREARPRSDLDIALSLMGRCLRARVAAGRSRGLHLMRLRQRARSTAERERYDQKCSLHFIPH